MAKKIYLIQKSKLIINSSKRKISIKSMFFIRNKSNYLKFNELKDFLKKRPNVKNLL